MKEDKHNYSHYRVAIKESSGDTLKLVFNKNDRSALENWMTELEKCRARRDGNFFNTLQQVKEDNEMHDYVYPDVIKTTLDLDIMDFKDFMTAISNGGRVTRMQTLTRIKSKATLRPKLTTVQRPESGISSIRSSQSIE